MSIHFDIIQSALVLASRLEALYSASFKGVTVLAQHIQSALQLCGPPDFIDRIALKPHLDCPDLFLEDFPAGREVYCCVPDPLKRKNTSTRDTPHVADLTVVGETVQTVDRARNPGYQDGKAKYGACAKISHLDGIKSLEFQGRAGLDRPQSSQEVLLGIRATVGCAHCLKMLALCVRAEIRIFSVGPRRPRWIIRYCWVSVHGRRKIDELVLVVLTKVRRDLNLSDSHAVKVRLPRQTLNMKSGMSALRPSSILHLVRNIPLWLSLHHQ